MRTALRGISQPKLTVSVVFLALLALVPARSASAAQLKEAQITQIVKDVNLLPGQAASRAAVINDNVRDGTAVRTGDDSRTELTFSDQTLARLGANTLFSFNEGTRKLDLGGGAMLLRVPKGAGGATVRTAAVTAAITGTDRSAGISSGDLVEADNRSAQSEARQPDRQFGLVTRRSKPAGQKRVNGLHQVYQS